MSGEPVISAYRQANIANESRKKLTVVTEGHAVPLGAARTELHGVLPTMAKIALCAGGDTHTYTCDVIIPRTLFQKSFVRFDTVLIDFVFHVGRNVLLAIDSFRRKSSHM